ncbi:tetratricopeptide repeat protein [Psychrobacter glacincola]|uniref:tetratricopeptide repeat protein n=1 Tax=Psychrobacter glacincola TaxID=56810 RepID=UPI003D0761FC
MLIWFVVGAIALSVIAFKYYGRNRESDSFKLMERLASQGDARAQINLAMMYYGGTGVRQDLPKAIQWAEKPARQGNAEALFVMGMMHTQKNDTKAFEFYLQSANQGYPSAQYELSLMYEKGIGVKQDNAKAFEWYLKSANQGNSQAQSNLGAMYDQGIGVQQDYAKAFEWYTRSASQGDARAQFNLGRMYHFGKGVQQDDAKARDWLGKSCKNGFQDACTIYRLLPKR